MKQNSKILLFVYGTLLNGFPLHYHLQKSSVKYLGEGHVEGTLYDLGAYPGAVPSASSSKIKGEVYELTDPKKLKELDEVEGYNPSNPKRSLFVRRRTNVKLVSGQTIPAWMYFLPRMPTKGDLIESGDYKKRLEFQK